MESLVRFERTVRRLQRHVLPLHYSDIMVPRLGLEPRTHTLKGYCSSQLSYRSEYSRLSSSRHCRYRGIETNRLIIITMCINTDCTLALSSAIWKKYLYRARGLDQYKGFEPSPTEWKSVMLPLHQYWIKEFLEENSINSKSFIFACTHNYALVGETGFEPARSQDQRILSPWRLPVTPLPHITRLIKVCRTQIFSIQVLRLLYESLIGGGCQNRTDIIGFWSKGLVLPQLTRVLSAPYF